jgi:hypothetical protein
MSRGLFLLLLLAVSPPAHGADRPSSLEDRASIGGVRVGLADRYVLGAWTCVDVTVRGGAAPADVWIRLTLPDGEGLPTHVSTDPAEPLRVEAGGAARARLYARFGRPRSSLQVELWQGDELLHQRAFTARETAGDDAFLPAIDGRRLIVVLGPAEAVEEAVRLEGLEPDRRAVVASVAHAADLPARWMGYDGATAVVVTTSDPAQLAPLLQASPQSAALGEWVSLGGRLVIGVGEHAQRVLAPGSPLAALMPGRFDRIVPLRQTGSLESYFRGTTPIPLAAGDEPMAIAQLTDIDGTIEVDEAGLPLVVRGASGFGQVTFLATALDRAPLVAWRDRPGLMARLLDLPAARADDAADVAGRLHFGYRDLAGQLRSALDQFPGVAVVPFWAIMGLAVVYLLLVGPADYFLLRRLGVPMQWTWLSSTLVIVVFGGAAVILGPHIKGREVQLHQAEVVDVDVASSRQRGHVWFNVYSPDARRYDLSIQPAGDDVSERLMAWQGLAGGALGGMSVDAQWADTAGQGPSYAFSPRLDALEGVPLQVWSSKSFVAQWHGRTGPLLRAELRDETQLPVGSIVNRSNLVFSECLLAYDRWAYDLGTLRPGQGAEFDALSKRSELRTVLTGRKIIFDDSKDKFRQETTPFDQTSLDAGYIVRAMLFHEAAGGDHYTGLDNDRHSMLDFSRLLRTGRAVLVARVLEAEAATSRIVCDGKPAAENAQRALYYRFVIPVEKSR